MTIQPNSALVDPLIYHNATTQEADAATFDLTTDELDDLLQELSHPQSNLSHDLSRATGIKRNNSSMKHIFKGVLYCFYNLHTLRHLNSLYQ